MTLLTERDRLPTRFQRILLWSRCLFFLTGVVALGYVGFTLLHARLYQGAANRSLESQIQLEKEHKPTPSKPLVREGDVLGRIGIPRLGVLVAVLQGTTSQTLLLGAGHIDGTAFPGEPGNIGIAAHRDTYFRGLKGVRKNDEVQLETASGVSRYAVDWIKIVPPEDVSVLAASKQSELTLVTCYPFYFVGSAPKRFIVHAHKQ